MSKRFTDTEIWNDEWFRNLPTKYKELWRYLYENCDIAGCWKINLSHLHFSMPGEQFTLDDILITLNSDKERVIVFDNNKRLFITKFINFQYGLLSTKCGPHLGVIKLFKDLLERGLPKGYLTLQDKDKDKDKDKRGGMGESQSKQMPYHQKFEAREKEPDFTPEANEYLKLIKLRLAGRITQEELEVQTAMLGEKVAVIASNSEKRAIQHTHAELKSQEE